MERRACEESYSRVANHGLNQVNANGIARKIVKLALIAGGCIGNKSVCFTMLVVNQKFFRCVRRVAVPSVVPLVWNDVPVNKATRE